MVAVDSAQDGWRPGEEPGTPVAQRSCRAYWFAGRVHQVLDEVTAGGVRVAGLTGAEIAEAVTELTRAQARIEGLRLQLLAQGDEADVAGEATPVATSTAGWLAAATRTPVGAAHRLVKLAKRMDAEFEATEAALIAGRVDADQAQVIVSAVDALPAFVGPADRRRAEQHLIDLAKLHDAKRLKILGKHLLHVIDPDGADEELAKRLEAEEAAAARKTVLKLFDDGDGVCHGSFRIPSLHGAMLRVALEALASPKLPDPIPREEPVDPDDPDAGVRTRVAPEILGEAFCQLLERFPTKKLPKAGGGLATVLVTIELDRLLDGLGVATMSTGGYVSAGQVRRLACTAGIIPQVLGSKSEVLDQGRKVRLHTEAQRIAMAARDKTCTAEGCQIPAAWCHAHHVVPWVPDGKTSVKDGRMVCPRHHTMIHHARYQAEYLTTGKIRITRRRQ